MNGDAEREVDIFSEALEVPLEERDAFLEARCGGDEALLAKMKELLDAYDRLDGFLEDPPTDPGKNGD